MVCAARTAVAVAYQHAGRQPHSSSARLEAHGVPVLATPHLRGFELPCFETAARVWLCLGFVDLELRLTGVFASQVMWLEHVNLDSEFEPGDMVLSPQCPALRELPSRARGMADLCIIS